MNVCVCVCCMRVGATGVNGALLVTLQTFAFPRSAQGSRLSRIETEEEKTADNRRVASLREKVRRPYSEQVQRTVVQERRSRSNNTFHWRNV